MPSSPRRYLTAYALWLFWPFYPFYALYLGRDTHAWLYSVTFGGLGLGNWNNANVETLNE